MFSLLPHHPILPSSYFRSNHYLHAEWLFPICIFMLLLYGCVTINNMWHLFLNFYINYIILIIFCNFSPLDIVHILAHILLIIVTVKPSICVCIYIYMYMYIYYMYMYICISDIYIYTHIHIFKIFFCQFDRHSIVKVEYTFLCFLQFLL